MNKVVCTQDPLLQLNHFMVVIEHSAEYIDYFTDGHLKWTTIDEKYIKTNYVRTVHETVYYVKALIAN